MGLYLDRQIFKTSCDLLGEKDAALKNILLQYGYPPYWSRKPVFETLIHIILEQQVSLASAKAALMKLKSRIGIINPANLSALSEAELKSCYFSRQKIRYARSLAHAILTGQLNLKALALESDDSVRTALKKLPGIGDWTVDIYLMMALHRPDCFPLGDIALVNSVKDIKQLPRETTKEEISIISNTWKPNRTVAAYLLWHSYLCKRKKQISIIL